MLGFGNGLADARQENSWGSAQADGVARPGCPANTGGGALACAASCCLSCSVAPAWLAVSCSGGVSCGRTGDSVGRDLIARHVGTRKRGSAATASAPSPYPMSAPSYGSAPPHRPKACSTPVRIRRCLPSSPEVLTQLPLAERAEALTPPGDRGSYHGFDDVRGCVRDLEHRLRAMTILSEERAPAAAAVQSAVRPGWEGLGVCDGRPLRNERRKARPTLI